VETTVEVGSEFRVRRVGRRGESTDDDLAARRQTVEAVSAQMAEPALDTMTEDGVADDLADHEPDPGRMRLGAQRRGEKKVHHQGVAAAASSAARHTPQVVTAGEAMLRR
jgi:hypothetical protein